MTIPDAALSHAITISAPPETVYELIADNTHTPRLSPTVVHIERLEGDDRGDVIQRWVMDNGAPRTWRVARTLDPEQGRISFDQLRAAPPVAAMHGEWSIRPAAGGQTRVELRHEWTLSGGDEETARRMAARMDAGITAQLRGLKRFAENLDAVTAHELAEETVVFVPGSVAEVSALLWDVERWPETLSGCRAVTVSAEAEGCVLAEIGTVPGPGAPEPHGGTARRCCVRPSESLIVWKQTEGLPEFYRSLRGAARLTPLPGGVEVRVSRTDSLDPVAVEAAGWTRRDVASRVEEFRSGGGLDPFTGIRRAEPLPGTASAPR
ncbi:SRPBCC family protein [Streptomyces roseoverticillatus]|uniref:SRPBCC family protein n=1 Tax=Streptomyces roseoverticillatus TaxID=66429 RepID=A0ABV3J263_9ACTN